MSVFSFIPTCSAALLEGIRVPMVAVLAVFAVITLIAAVLTVLSIRRNRHTKG